MRRLGQALGFEAMSLYNHVANKDDVVDGILDLVLAETEPPSSAVDWDASIRKSAISVHDALRRHPWSCALLMAPGRVRPARLRYMDLLLGRLRDAGFSAEYDLLRVPRARRTHLRLLALGDESHVPRPRTSRRLVAKFAQEDHRRTTFRTSTSTRSSTTAEGPHRDVSAFELGLDLIIDGLEDPRHGLAARLVAGAGYRACLRFRKSDRADRKLADVLAAGRALADLPEEVQQSGVGRRLGENPNEQVRTTVAMSSKRATRSSAAPCSVRPSP